MTTRTTATPVARMLVGATLAVLLTMVAAPRLAAAGDGPWWRLLPWGLLALLWTAVGLRVARDRRRGRQGR